VLCGNFTLRKYSLVRQTWVALAVVSFIKAFDRRAEKIRQILGGPGIHFLSSLHVTTGPLKPRERLQGHPEGGEITTSNACKVSLHPNAPSFVSPSSAPSAKVSGNPTGARA
jgi:hypothetical protein